MAAGLSWVCAQEHCSRMLTWVYRYGLRPPRWAIARNVERCSFGEQEQTTIPSSFFSRIICTIDSWAESEHANISTRVATTSPCLATSARTFSVST